MAFMMPLSFGDEFDYAAFTVEESGKYSFTIDTTNAAKFTVYSLTEKGGKYTQKALLSQAVKAKGSATTAKTVQLEAGTVYYVSMQGTNAKKGAEVYYNVTANLTSTTPKAALDMPNDLFASSQTNDVLSGVAAYDVDSQLIDDKQALQSFVTLA